jgi:hypothetical protein
MKTLAKNLTLFCILALLPCIMAAQTITINSVSTAGTCSGDSISVTFTVTGNWGHKNAFALQLSDPDGSFASTFTNLGSIKDSIPGTFTLQSSIPSTVTASSKYHVRIIGAYPYIASTDTSTDIIIHKAPSFRITYSSSATPIVGMPIDFTLGSSDLSDASQHFTVTWNFGDGASPASAVDSVFNNIDTILHKSITYSSAGTKTITVTLSNGCSTTVTTQVVIYGCVYPSISHRTIVVDSDTDIANPFRGNAYWINPGVNVKYVGDFDTLYLESGATLTIDPAAQSVIYLKKGSSLIAGSVAIVTYDSGASVSLTLYSPRVLCPGLNFDYTNAPPNKAFPQQGVVREDAVLAKIMISPNPATNSIELQNVPATTMGIDVFNLLGETVMHIAPQHSDNLRINLSQLQSGSYYLRVVSQSGVTTKKIVKE